MSDQLYVVTALSNPMRFQSRWRLYERFARKMAEAGVHLTTVELVYDDQITYADRIADAIKEELVEARWPGFNYIPLRTRDVLWAKENLQNIGADSLPPDAKNVLFCDADIEFQNPNWVGDILAALDHYDVVQPWTYAQDLDPNHNPVVRDGKPLPPSKSFFAAHLAGDPDPSKIYDSGNWHPGFAMAWRRDALNEVGGLLDNIILGSGDRHMCCGLIGQAAISYDGRVSQGYKDNVLGWQARADAVVHRNIGIVPGLINHFWHGSKRLRYYRERWQILIDSQFNPATDLKMQRTTGLWHWSELQSPRMRKLRDDVRAYFAARMEDDVRVD